MFLEQIGSPFVIKLAINRLEVSYIIFVAMSRCQIGVHQECYGAKDVQDVTSWVCRACETPDVIRECCLCPVRGMLPISSVLSSS